MYESKPICVICAWRATCQKQFTLKAGQRCPDFVKDITIKTEEEEEKKEKEKKD
ncbi:MAG: hypothetical protein NZ809_01330 [Thermodesulfovibrio sp.]|nr:hypothetical protein [Thermodesulfovibrio sp.]